MSDEVNFFEWGFKAVIGVCLTVFAYLWNRNDNDIEGLNKHIGVVESMAQNSRIENKDTLLAIAGLRTHISENYSPRLETQISIARVHEKIEKLNDDVVKLVQDLRTDIREDMRGALAMQTRALTNSGG